MSLLLSHHRPGASWLHRAGAGPKLLGVAALGLAVVLTRGPWWGLAAVGLGVALVASSGIGVAAAWRGLRAMLVAVALLAAWLTWQSGWERAVASVGDLVGLILVATVLTVTTPVEEMLDTITRGLAPFRRLGVNPDRVALAFALMIRSVPTTVDLARQSRQAAMARGVERDPRALLVPYVIRLVAHGFATGQALAARGLGDDADPVPGGQPGSGRSA